MGKVKVDKIECRYPTLFKIMWLSTIIWIIVGITNYIGHWLIPEKLDEFGMSILFLFGVSIFICFGKSILDLVSQNEVLAIDSLTKKVASYAFMISFAIFLTISIWKLCGSDNSHSDFARNGAVTSISWEAILSIIGNIIQASMFSIATVMFYWYIRMCFVYFSYCEVEIYEK